MFAGAIEYINLLDKIISKKSNSGYLILMYHRVIPPSRIGPGIQAGMYVEPDTFEMHIEYLKKYFNIVKLSETILCNIRSDNINKNMPFCYITFDDGWYDFFEFAYPILLAHKVPATVFLPTRYVGTRNQFWTDQISDMFIKKETNCINNDIKYRKNSLIEKIESQRGPTRVKIERAISILKNYKEDVILDTLQQLEEKWGMDPVSSERSFLSWEEVREMKETGFITFGSHTNYHKILTYLNDEEIIEELIRSKNALILEKAADPYFLSFCYPNGNYDKRVVKMLGETGYHVAVTTEKGWNDQTTSLFTLRRVGLHQDISSTRAMFGCRIANIY